MIPRLRLAAFSAMVLSISVASGRAPVAQTAAPAYTVIDLGAWPGGQYSTAASVNPVGEVVGWGSAVVTIAGSNVSVNHAFRWKDVNGNGISDPGETIDLSPASGASTFARGINDASHVVGVMSVDTGFGVWTTHGFFQSPVQNGGTIQDTPVVFNAADASSPYELALARSGLVGINANGDMVGWAWDFKRALRGATCPFGDRWGRRSGRILLHEQK